MFHGSLTALVTPMREDGGIDEDAYARLIDWQIAEGTHGLVPVGTTGESPTLTHDEHKRVVELAIAAARGRVPVMAGAGSNSTAEAIGLAQHAEKARRGCGAGGHALLQQADAGRAVPPLHGDRRCGGYCRCSSTIFRAVRSSTCRVETMARLARIKNIVGVKDATANLTRPLHTHARLRARISSSFRARTIPRWRISPPAGMAAFRSPPMWRRGCAPRCMPPGRSGDVQAGDGDPGAAGAAA